MLSRTIRAVSPKATHALRIGISLSLAVGLLYLFLRHVKLDEVKAAIRSADLFWIGVACGLSLVVVPLRSARWILLLSRAGRVGLWDATVSTYIGFAASTLLPARAGEVVRPVVLARRTRLPVAPLIASVGLERLLDLVCVVVVFVVLALGGSAPATIGIEEAKTFGRLRNYALLLGAGTLFGLTVFGLLAVRPELTTRVLEPLLKVVPARFREKATSLVHSFLEGLGALRTPREILVMALSGIGLWLFICLQIWCAFRAFHLDFPYPVTFFVLAWSVMGLAIPTPGGVGGYHTAVKYSLTGFYAVAEGPATAFAIVLHAVSFVPVTIIGLILLAAGGLKLGTLAHEGDAPPTSPIG